jgi:hypothetical protein
MRHDLGLAVSPPQSHGVYEQLTKDGYRISVEVVSFSF